MSLANDHDVFCQGLKARVTAPGPTARDSINIFKSIIKSLIFDDDNAPAAGPVLTVALDEQKLRRANFGNALVTLINLNDQFMNVILKMIAMACDKGTFPLPHNTPGVRQGNGPATHEIHQIVQTPWKINLGDRAQIDVIALKCLGFCEHTTNTIKIQHQHLTDTHAADTVIHEMFHACITILFSNIAVPFSLNAPLGDADRDKAEALFKNTYYGTAANKTQWDAFVAGLLAPAACKTEIEGALNSWVEDYGINHATRPTSGIEEMYGYFMSIVYHLRANGVLAHDKALVAAPGPYSDIYKSVDGLMEEMHDWEPN